MDGRAWRIWAAAAAVYLIAMLHRSSLSVAGLTAAERFHINAAQLSSFTVLQLLVYAGMQLPVGLLLDRYGSRRLLAAGATLMTLGQIGFAFTTSYPLALFARALVGLGDATAFLSVLRLAAVWFPPWRNPLLTQLTSLSGQIGALVTAVPMAWALTHWGWTSTYLAAALSGVLAAVAMYLVVVDHPSNSPAGSSSHPPLLPSLRASWADAGTRFGFWAYFAGMFLPNTLLLLWGYPWLVDGEGVSPTFAPMLLMVLTAASMLTGPVVGTLAGHHPNRRPTLFFAILVMMILSWATVIFWPGPPPATLLCIVMAVVGTGFSGALLAFDYARACSPPQRLGAALAIVNVGGFASTISVIFSIGLVLDWAKAHGHSNHAYFLAMCVPFAAWGLGLVQMLRLRSH